MRFTQAREELYEALQVVQKAVPTRSTLPILTGIYMEIKNQKMRLMATDLEIGIECSLPVQNGEEGSSVLEARYLTEIVRKMPGGNVDLTIDPEGKGAVIKSGRTHFNLRTMPSADYPSFPSLEETQTWEMSKASLKKLIRETSFAVALEDSRPFLTGILMETDGQEIKMVSTDTSRLAVSKISSPCPANISVIIPSKTLNELARILKDDENPVVISLSGNQVLFEIDGVKVTSRLIEGQFPNYKQVVPTEFQTRLKVEKTALLDSVERVSLLSREGTSVVKLGINGDTLGLSTFVQDVGEAKDEVLAKKEGDDIEVAFNSRFMTEVLRVMDTTAVELLLTGGKGPALFRPVGDENYSYVVMPVLIR